MNRFSCHWVKQHKFVRPSFGGEQVTGPNVSKHKLAKLSFHNWSRTHSYTDGRNVFAMSQSLWSFGSRFTNGPMEDGSNDSTRCGTRCGTWLQFLLIFVSRSLQDPAISSRTSVSYQRRDFRQARIRESDVCSAVCDWRELSLIQGEQHLVKGLYVACHLVTLQSFEAPEAPDGGLLMSSGLLNVTGQFSLKAANHVLPLVMLTNRSFKLGWSQLAKVAPWRLVWLGARVRGRMLCAIAKSFFDWSARPSSTSWRMQKGEDCRTSFLDSICNDLSCVQFAAYNTMTR